MKVYRDNISHIFKKAGFGCLLIFTGAALGFAIYVRNESDYLSYLIPTVLVFFGIIFLYRAFIANTVLIVSDKGLVLSYLGRRYSKLIPWSDIASLEQIFFVKAIISNNSKATFGYIMLKSPKNLNLPKARLTRMEYVHCLNGKNAIEVKKITSDVQALIPVSRIQVTDRGILSEFFARDKFGMGPVEYWDRMKFYGELTLKEILSYKR